MVLGAEAVMQSCFNFRKTQSAIVLAAWTGRMVDVESGGSRQRINRDARAICLRNSALASGIDRGAADRVLRDVRAGASGGNDSKRSFDAVSVHGSSLRLFVGRTVLEKLLLLYKPAKGRLGKTAGRETSRVRRRGGENTNAVRKPLPRAILSAGNVQRRNAAPPRV